MLKLKKILKRMLYTILILVAIIGIGAAIVLNLPNFGAIPSGERLARIEQSPNYRDGQFQNLEHTPQLTSRNSFWQTLYEYFFPDVKDLSPAEVLPAVQTDLSTLPDNSMVWFGHSSYLLNLNQKKILVDPVFYSGSPFWFMVKPFKATYNYSSADMPAVIDILVLTHDHWDHLDYTVMKELKDRVQHVVCPLGAGAHLEYWGFDPAKITELDWQDETTVDSLKFTCLPTRHFSGRGLRRAKSLWGSFMVETGTYTVYIGGDGGYGKHIAEIGKRFPHIDLALMENGQYNENWKYIHFLPEDLRKALNEIGAKRYFTGHNSKFVLAQHPWYEPMRNVQAYAKEDSLNVITPKIGEVVHIDQPDEQFEVWF
ncbi:MBL fold metallo-hydrolase [Capnocytophaga sp. HP1101]